MSSQTTRSPGVTASSRSVAEPWSLVHRVGVASAIESTKRKQAFFHYENCSRKFFH
jgi:hypothetical protein